jgi:hypothetical protein
MGMPCLQGEVGASNAMRLPRAWGCPAYKGWCGNDIPMRRRKAGDRGKGMPILQLRNGYYNNIMGWSGFLPVPSSI